jgi:hypothetical protein
MPFQVKATGAGAGVSMAGLVLLCGWFRFRIAAGVPQPRRLHVFHPVFAGPVAKTRLFPDAFPGASL